MGFSYYGYYDLLISELIGTYFHPPKAPNQTNAINQRPQTIVNLVYSLSNTALLTGALLNVGLLDGLLGAGMIVNQWIIPLG